MRPPAVHSAVIGSTATSCLLALFLASSHGSGQAQPLPVAVNGADSRVSIDIPASRLSDALEAFAHQTGISVAVDVSHMYLETHAVRGQMHADEGLEKLLRGTGLHARVLAADSIVVYKPQPKAFAGPLFSPAVLAAHELAGMDTGNAVHWRYAAQLQYRVIGALCSNTLTRPGAYRLAMQLQVDAKGRISHHKRLDTTGSVLRDARIDRLMTGLHVGLVPPAGLPQPAMILVLPDSPDTRPVCPLPRVMP